MKNILVGTDFDEGSIRALDRACQLSEKFGSVIHLLHVLEPVDDPDSDDPETKAFYAKLEAAANEKLARAKVGREALTIESSVLVGHRHPKILEMGESLNADLIVLGHRPIASGSERVGTSHKVAMTANRDVLLVP